MPGDQSHETIKSPNDRAAVAYDLAEIIRDEIDEIEATAPDPLASQAEQEEHFIRATQVRRGANFYNYLLETIKKKDPERGEDDSSSKAA